MEGSDGFPHVKSSIIFLGVAHHWNQGIVLKIIFGWRYYALNYAELKEKFPLSTNKMSMIPTQI